MAPVRDPGEPPAEPETSPNNSKKPVDAHPFSFPFPPYDIQKALMKKAYDAFEDAKFALLESPTGTGKSLSMICSSLTWLRDHQRKTRQVLEKERDELAAKIEKLRKEEEASGDWLSAQTCRQEENRKLIEVSKQLERLDKFDARNQARRHARLHGIPLENYTALMANNDLNKTTDGLLDESRDVNLIGGGASQESNKSELDKEEDEDIEKKVAQQDEDHVRPKIFYASRTHSQLSQFVNEVKRTRFAKPEDTSEAPIKVAALASRANLCVNPDVLALRDANAINERCMEMQKETNKEKRCPYIKAKLVNGLKEEILSEVHDIEDLVSRGRSKGACAYYASRMAIPEAELVVLPYNNLLHRETRQAASLDLKESIVIVDEAHNILETICSIHSAAISGWQLLGCHSILSRYHQKYASRMNPRNASAVKFIVQCLTAMIRYLNNPGQHIKDYETPKAVNLDESVIVTSTTNSSDSNKHTKNAEGKICKPVAAHQELMIDVNKFAGAANIERFNVFRIVDHMNRSQLARKLLGLYRQEPSIDLSLELHKPTPEELAKLDSDISSPPSKKKKRTKTVAKTKTEIRDNVLASEGWQFTSLKFLDRGQAGKSPYKEDDLRIYSYPVYPMMEFLRALTNLTDDGKILTDHHEGNIFKSSLKFLLLNPASQFKQMVEEARSIVLAGGTMQPFDEFIELLFGPLGVDESRLSLFSCGHVISSNHLCMSSLSKGPTGKPLELSYRMKSSFETIDEIGRAIEGLAAVAPGGMICFFPSYDYEHICYTRWTQIGIIPKIETRHKHLFREPRQAIQLKPIFEDYAKKIERGKSTGRGSLLFCVVGGKMSEGINFSDDLGRCVVMVGLPYANIKSGELKEKMTYYDRACKKSDGVGAGQKYYVNLCVKGINQSIGRAIRHRNDYAAVVLLDQRYQSKNDIKGGLPKWMCKSMKEHNQFDALTQQVKSFFENIQSNLS